MNLLPLLTLLVLSVFASSSSPFQLQLQFTTEMSLTQQGAFENATARWERIITGGIVGKVTIHKGDSFCDQPPANQDTIVNDILIFAAVKPIDGPGGFLGQAGPCAFDTKGQIRLGLVTVDSADVRQLEASEALIAVVTHLVAHVLGFGSEWGSKGLVSPTQQGTPFLYLGSAGISGQLRIQGTGNPDNTSKVRSGSRFISSISIYVLSNSWE